MSSLLERLGVKTPTAPEIQDPTSSRELIFKKLNDLFCPGFKSPMNEIPDDPVQYPALKDLQTILNGIYNLARYGFGAGNYSIGLVYAPRILFESAWKNFSLRSQA